MSLSVGNENGRSLIALEYVSPVVLTLLLITAFHQLHASYRVGPNTADLEGMPSFTKANFVFLLTKAST
jgi:hypothetical protein